MLLNNIILRKHMAFIILTSALSTSYCAGSVPISYSKAIRLALANNPKIHAANASVEAAVGASKQADSMSWPQLGLEVSGARTDNPMSVFGYKLSQGNASFADFGANEYTGLNALYTKPQALNHPGYYSNLDTAFKLSVPIYSGGRIKAQQAQMRALVASAQRGNQQAQNQLAYEVYASYERVLTANQLVSVAQQQVARARAFLSTTKALKKQSITLESDVLMAEAYLNSSLIGLSNAKIQTEDELDSFRTLLGAPGSSFVPSRHMDLTTKIKLNTSLINHALKDNPSIKALQARLHAEKAAIAASQALYKPQVSMQLRHDWNGNTIGSGLPSDTIALGATWTLFSAGERAGAVQVASANAKKVQFELDEQRNQLRLQLTKIQRAEQQTLYEVRLSRQSAEKEDAVIQKLKQRFGRGLVPLSALLESQMKLTQAKAQELQALHQLRIHQAHWLMLGNQLIPKAVKSA
ncbi:TPA: TolC family protein [Legionella pneumophila]|uniref:TolC family protein n=1 Tax=Legionella TaxID=445 RepID=UPI0016052CD1|nr:MULTISPECIES: TolC family protein [Legionella]MCK1847888.1 TolC family protein [Legionella pneumophila]HAT1880061.1 TolC family protein [Legionella pneumophila]HBD9445004.1 TolC family protein [Legionella pneumophila]HCE5644180.1 TolC family protein [Legionella pneumophila]HCE5647226.1 TolC family protein [Legionella pneumophila]